MSETKEFPDLESLSGIRMSLAAGLAEAFEASAGTRLSWDEALHAAHSAVDGHGLSPEVTAIFGKKPVAALVGFDADRIQGWVFASERIQVAAGASLLLEDLNKEACSHLASESEISRHLCGLIYSAGGAGILLANARVVRDRGAEKDFCTAIATVLEKKCPGLTFTVAAVPLYAWDLEKSGDGGTLKAGPAGLDRFEVVTGLKGALTRLQVRIRERKDGQPKLRPSGLRREEKKLLATRCPSCGTRTPDNPASEGQEPTPENWCEWCKKVSRALRKSDRRFKDKDGNPITFAGLAERIQQPRQYLGFLALDGNGLGRTSREIGSLVELCAFSQAVTAIYRRARRLGEQELKRFCDGENPEASEVETSSGDGATAEGDAQEQSKSSKAHLSLLTGGDEITLVLPAGAAPAVAHVVATAVEEGFELLTGSGGYLSRAFESNSKVLEDLRRSGSGVGLVLADSHFPVRFLRRYAGLLQKRAKEFCKAQGARSALSWELLTDGSPLTEEPGERKRTDDLTLEGLKQQLEDVVVARREGLGQSALHTVLRYRGTEELGLRSVAAAELREEVLAQLTANFFRYQLARNSQLAGWWQGTSKPDPSSRELVAWFRNGGGLKLDRLLDLMSLVPVHTSGRTA